MEPEMDVGHGGIMFIFGSGGVSIFQDGVNLLFNVAVGRITGQWCVL